MINTLYLPAYSWWKVILLGVLFCVGQVEGSAPAEKLFSAIEIGDAAAAKALIAERIVPLDARNEKGQTPFMVACMNRQIEIAKALIAAGCDVNEKSRAGSWALGFAAETDDLDLVKMMVERGADLEKIYPPGMTLLHQTIGNNTKNIVPYLIEKGVDVNARDKEGATPLMYAAVRGKINYVRLLLEAGADPHATMPDYRAKESGREITVLTIAIRERRKKTVHLLEQAMGIRTDGDLTMGTRTDADLTSMEGDPW